MICQRCAKEKADVHTCTPSDLVRKLEAQLAAMTAERDLFEKVSDIRLSESIASQAREQQLREALQEALADVSWGVNSGLSGLRDTERDISDALSLLQNDTALRQWGAKLLRKTGDTLILKAVGATNIPMQTGSVRDYLHRKACELEEGKRAA